MRTRLNGRARVAGRTGRAAFVLALAGGLLSGCGAANNPFNTQTAPDEPLPTIGDRFNQLFGRKSQAVGEVAAAPDGVTEVGLKTQEAPAPSPEQAKLTAALNPFCGVTVSVAGPLPPELTVREAGEARIVKFGCGRLIV